MNALKKILFVVNYSKANSEAMLNKLIKICEEMKIFYDVISGKDENLSAFKNKDVCCVIGGDGTILKCLKGAVSYDVPIFGINLGKLGFLANLSDNIDAEKSFKDILSGKYKVAKNTLLEGKLANGEIFFALNEFVLKSKNLTNMMSLQVWANKEYVADYVGDGLIFSTATGSTAYNLSAGGPLIHQNSSVFVMTSICPHTLSTRSLVFDAKTKIFIKDNPATMLLIDGHTALDLNGDFQISTSKKSLKFLHEKKHSHFLILRKKLAWGDNPRKV